MVIKKISFWESVKFFTSSLVLQDLIRSIFKIDINRFYNKNNLWLHHDEHWLNMGYWKDTTDYHTAATCLAMLLSEYAKLNNHDVVLDVGNGYAEQDIFWAKNYNSKITALNINEDQIIIGKKRVAEHGLQNSIEIKQGSATCMPFANEIFTKIMALECAFHFDTREKFFSEAFRVLKPNGILCLTDIIPNHSTISKSKLIKFFQKKLRKLACIPEKNMYDYDHYLSKCYAAGFSEVEIISIKEHVFDGYAKYYKNMMGKHSSNDVPFAIQYWENILGIGDYIIVIAKK